MQERGIPILLLALTLPLFSEPLVPLWLPSVHPSVAPFLPFLLCPVAPFPFLPPFYPCWHGWDGSE